MAYDKAQEAVLKAYDSISFEQAEAIGEEIGKSTRSVIAKVKSLDIPYVPKKVAPKRPAGKTKAELVSEVEASFGGQFDLSGLSKATGATLVTLLGALGSKEAEVA